MIGSYFKVFIYSDNVHFKTCDWSQVSRRCPWRFLAKSKTKQPIPVQPSRRAFERGLDSPQCLADCVEDVRTSEQHRLDARSSFSNFYMELDFRSRHCLGSFYKMSGRRGNTFGRCPTFQNILDYRSNVEMSYSEDRLDAWPSRTNVYLLWKELSYSGRRWQKTILTRITFVWTLDS